MDTLFIKQLKAQAIIGIYPAERRYKQPVEIDVEIDVDAQAIAQTDAIEKAIDYETLVNRLLPFVEGSQYRLLETLAEKTAEFILAEFKSLTRLKLTVRKPKALAQTPQVGITLERHL